MGAHVEHGVDLRCGVTVTEVTDDSVRLADGELVVIAAANRTSMSQPGTTPAPGLAVGRVCAGRDRGRC